MTFEQFRAIQGRRESLRSVGGGVGMAALVELLAADGLTAAEPSSPVGPHFAPKAKSVIFMFMEGGPRPVRTVRSEARTRALGRSVAA